MLTLEHLATLMDVYEWALAGPCPPNMTQVRRANLIAALANQTARAITELQQSQQSMAQQRTNGIVPPQDYNQPSQT